MTAALEKVEPWHGAHGRQYIDGTTADRKAAARSLQLKRTADDRDWRHLTRVTRKTSAWIDTFPTKMLFGP